MNDRDGHATSHLRALAATLSRHARGALEDPLLLLRMGLSVVMLVRHEDFLRGLVAFEHYEWGAGPEFGPQSLAPVRPQFAPPLLPGLDALLPWSAGLCRLRLALTGLLFFGVFRRTNAFLLGVVSLGLFAADGFRYLHHLLVLYVSVLFLAFDHEGRAASDGGKPQVPFALLVLRAHVLVVYFAAGLAKLNATWLSGRTVAALSENGFVKGVVLELTVDAVGTSGLSIAACSTELLAPLLLVFRRTRALGALLAVLLHGFIHETMLVSTFGGTMVILLLSFLPCAAERQSTTDERGRASGAAPVGPTRLRAALAAAAVALASPVVAAALGTGVGSYSMFTRLVHYDLRVEVDGQPFSRERLASHLGRDGARIVRLANGLGIGETNVHILRKALPDLGAFVCRLRTGAQSAVLELTTRRIEGGPEQRTNQRTTCGSLAKSPRPSEEWASASYYADCTRSSLTPSCSSSGPQAFARRFSSRGSR